MVNSCACRAGSSVHGDMQFVYSMQSTSKVTRDKSGKAWRHGGAHNKARLLRCEQGIKFEELLGVIEIVGKHDHRGSLLSRMFHNGSMAPRVRKNNDVTWIDIWERVATWICQRDLL